MDTSKVAKEAKSAPAHPVTIKINEIAELLTRDQTMTKLQAVTTTINRAINKFRRQPMLSGSVLASRLTTLVIEEAHRRTLHGETQLTLAYTRQRYRIIGGRGTVRAYIQRCSICTRHRGRQAQQQMGQLPATRTSAARAFLPTGVDYAGPFAILKWRPMNAQPGSVHIAVFVCFITSAVHSELVTRQITEALIGAYKRFTGRRAVPAVMYSDNATTFIQAAFATNETQWSFSPPRTPHFGGKWEEAVKSIKYHLRRVLGTTTLTCEELNSVLIQVEACLNSRPICPISDDPDDLQVLTPGYILIGEPIQLIPEPSIIDKNSSKLQRWNPVAQSTQQFWSRTTYTELDRPITKLCLLPSDPPPLQQPPEDDTEEAQQKQTHH
ncbi:uncharacterized protein LOC107044378 [Diachasma alloeum]|uniref:uncharacterized protein LOC107044378 n=1 Tax=Diachasma alloeum TaxID=454923 RepID=UPI0007384587|nr:uncharacterized protein LOC107044378 [Diachasma alloeum]